MRSLKLDTATLCSLAGVGMDHADSFAGADDVADNPLPNLKYS